MNKPEKLRNTGEDERAETRQAEKEFDDGH